MLTQWKLQKFENILKSIKMHVRNCVCPVFQVKINSVSVNLGRASQRKLFKKRLCNLDDFCITLHPEPIFFMFAIF